MEKLEQRNLKSSKEIPLSRQAKVIILTAIIIGGLGIAFGAMSLGLFLGNPPTVINNYYDQSPPDHSYYTQSFQITGLPGDLNGITGENLVNISYFFNLSLGYKTTLDLVMVKNIGGGSLEFVKLYYNISVNGVSSRAESAIFSNPNMQPNFWYYNNLVVYTLPNGSNTICQFRIQHGGAAWGNCLGNFQIIIGYTVYF